MNHNTGLVVGITGQSGSGKTLVGSLLAQYGFHVIDADIVSRKVVEPGSALLTELAKTFGNNIILPNGQLNRGRLAEIVFNDESKKQQMEDIMFPSIVNEIKNQIRTLQSHGSPAIFLDAPTLFESGADNLCHKIITVIAPRELRFQRLLARDSITPEQVEARIKSQKDDDYYISRSDYVIENIAKPHQLESRVLDILQDLGLTEYIEGQ